jgi:hypothetical protein
MTAKIRHGGLMHPLSALTALGAVLTLAGPASADAELTLPLGPAQLESWSQAHPAATLEDFIAALPPSLPESFVLLHASRSLQHATPTLPRQIMFGSDARFLLAISADPTDPRYDVAEFAAFDASEGRYRFGTITFAAGAAPAVATDLALCEGCHGAPARPIWGEYPDWPGAYSDNEGLVAAGERAAFAAFVAAQPTAPRYRHLRISAPADGSRLGLPARRYPYANTDLNHELANTVALGAVTRMRAHPDYASWRWAVLATSDILSCIDTNAWTDLTSAVNAAYAAGPATRFGTARTAFVKAVRLLGIDPVAEWSLERLAPETDGGSAGRWQTGAYQLQEAVAFAVLQDLLPADPVLAAAFADQAPTVDMIAGKMRLVGADRAEALRRSYAWFPFFDVFDPVADDRRTLARVCAALADHLPR